MIFGKFFPNAGNKKALEALDRAHEANDAGNIELAIQYFTQAIDCQDPAIRTEAFAWRSQLYVALEQYKDALYDLNKALTISPEEWSLFGKRGEVHFLMGQLELAFADCERALSMDETDQYSRKVLATVLKQQGRFLEALAETEALLLDTPNDPWVLTLNAEMLFETENFEGCVRASTMALQVAESEAMHAFHVRADALKRLGKCSEAARDYERALDVGADDPLIYVGRAECYLEMDLLDEAAADIAHAIGLDMQNDAAFNTSARINLARQRFKAAMSDADLAVALNSDNHFARKTRAKIFMIKEMWHEAIDDLTVALKYRDNLMRASCYGMRAHCYNMLEKYEEAIADANRGEECDPENGMAYANRAYAFLKHGEVDACLGECNRGLKLDRSQPELHKVKAQARIKQKDYEGAVADCTSALQIDPRYVEAYEVRATALDYLEHYDDAARDRRQAEKFHRLRDEE